MNKIPQQLILQLFLILLNAFFAMTEIAVISLSPAKLRKLAEEGDRQAPRLLKLVEEPAGFLSTIQTVSYTHLDVYKRQIQARIS